jgi:hypothetical protein
VTSYVRPSLPTMETDCAFLQAHRIGVAMNEQSL